ncbi:MAG: hypothetical protein SNG14_08260 [Rikenellaceae bacterium]
MKKMMKRGIIYSLVLTAVAMGGFAAEVDKEVEVTRAYVPEVKGATKLRLTPDLTDDSYIKPDIDYSITPVSIETTLETARYQPVSINLEEYEPQGRYYTKLGVGAPLQTVADLYATPIVSSEGYLMGYLNQRGQFADRESNYGVGEDAVQNYFRGGVAAGRRVLKRTLEGGVNYENERWSRYATDGDLDRYPLYQSIDFKGRYGDDFTNMQRLNFAVSGGAEYFWSRSDYYNGRFDVGALVGRGFGGGEVVVGGGYRSVWGADDYLNNTLNIGAKYGARGENWGVKVGFGFYNDRVSYSPHQVGCVALSDNDTRALWSGSGTGLDLDNRVGNYLVPDVELSYNISGRMAVGYFRSEGELLYRDFATLSRENPYIAAGLFSAESGVRYNTSLGVKGAINDGRLGYNLSLGYEAIKNNLYWVLVESWNGSATDNAFLASYSTQSSFSLNGSIEYQPLSNLNLWTEFKFASYDNDEMQVLADCEPSVELRLGAKYRLGNWRFGLDGELLGSRECSWACYPYNWTTYDRVEIPATFDLGVSVDYRVKRSMVIFAEARNLINDDLYRWVGYREYGINVMAGVKMELF